MSLKRTWLAVLVVLALLVAACGPDMSTPVPGGQTPTEAATPAATQAAQATNTPVTSVKPPVDPNDWRALGSADATVTLTEYSDFQ